MKIREDGNPLRDNITDNIKGILTITNAKQFDADAAYICSSKDPNGKSQMDSSPAYLNVSLNARMF